MTDRAVEQWMDPCPTCGIEASGWQAEAVIEYRQRSEPAWDGGPLVSVGRPEPVKVGTVFSLEPCGHKVPTLKMYRREATPA